MSLLQRGHPGRHQPMRTPQNMATLTLLEARSCPAWPASTDSPGPSSGALPQGRGLWPQSSQARPAMCGLS